MDLGEEFDGEKMVTMEDVPPIAEAKVPQDADCVSPVTPEYHRENGDVQSPLTLSGVSNKLKQTSIDSECKANGSVNNDDDDGDSPRTPKKYVFDPFAPGPDNMARARARAPQCYNYLDKSKITPVCQLDFLDSCDDAAQHQNAECLLDEALIERVYKDLMEVIVSSQTEEGLTEIAHVEYDSDDCKTPSSAPRITGIADTCPPAPRRPACRSRISPVVGLCKKLF